mgnify:CR=1 FL=1
MRASDKIKVRQRRFAHVALIVVSFSLMFVGKADLVAMRDARISTSCTSALLSSLLSDSISSLSSLKTRRHGPRRAPVDQLKDSVRSPLKGGSKILCKVSGSASPSGYAKSSTSTLSPLVRP